MCTEIKCDDTLCSMQLLSHTCPEVCAITEHGCCLQLLTSSSDNMAASIASIDSVRLLTQMLRSTLDEVSFLL